MSTITITAMTAIAARMGIITDAAWQRTKKNPPAANAQAGYVR